MPVTSSFILYTHFFFGCFTNQTQPHTHTTQYTNQTVSYNKTNKIQNINLNIDHSVTNKVNDIQNWLKFDVFPSFAIQGH